jgi:hypothetical protein
MRRRTRLLAPALTACLLVPGCGTAPAGSYHLSGKATFNGKAVPAGRIFFLPDTSRGNSGRGGYAEIKEGIFDTAKKGAATPGGALIVRIDGFDGQAGPANYVGQPLFLTYEMKLEVPRANSTKDFDVPASAGRNLSKGGGEPP